MQRRVEDVPEFRKAWNCAAKRGLVKEWGSAESQVMFNEWWSSESNDALTYILDSVNRPLHHSTPTKKVKKNEPSDQ
jgi:hypothetical protein